MRPVLWIRGLHASIAFVGDGARMHVAGTVRATMDRRFLPSVDLPRAQPDFLTTATEEEARAEVELELRRIELFDTAKVVPAALFLSGN